jgi:hypothetical protein
MNLRNSALVAFGVAAVPLAYAAYSLHRDVISPPAEMTPRGHIAGGRSEGDGRFELLMKLTKVYVERNADAPAAMRKGAELAPETFLNQQLEAEGLKWRVRDIHGLVSETYEVT